MKTRVLLIPILIVAILFVVVIFFQIINPGTDKEPDQGAFKDSENIDIEEESGVSSKTGSGGASGSGGAGVTTGEPSSGITGLITSSSKCEILKISYSASNFNAESVCNQYENGICIDKTVTCSITITNLDDEIGGIFKLAFRFFERENEENIIHSTFSESFLEPGSQQTFEGTFNVQSQGENGNANKDLTCFYRILSIPQKEIC
ncbi:MAG: hypothetical protein IIA87_03045 [Nanoarchaeota archaeon]|nr:hypothetical protein [Nanoarchaeota archaeon]